MKGSIYSENIQNIHDNMNIIKKKLNDLRLEQIKGEKPILVVLLGGTGSGKSTFMHILAGKKLVLHHDQYGIPILDAEVPWEEFTIGHDHESQTEIPGIWFDKKRNIIFCDCPGFYDTKGPMQEIINLFVIFTLLTYVKQLKVALLIGQEDATALRGSQARSQFKMIENLSLVKLSPKGISFIITHANEELEKPEKLQGILHKMGQDDNENLLNLISKESDKRIFIFKEPDDGSNENTEYNKFTKNDIDRFINFVKDKSDMFQPNKKVPLNEISLLFVLSIINSFDKMDLLIQEITSKIKDEYEYEVDINPNSLNKWKNFMCTFKTKFSSLTSFITTINKSFTGYKYEKIYEKIRHIEYFIPIIDRIDFSKLSTTESAILQNFRNSISMNNVEKCLNEGFKHIINEIAREEQRRNAEQQRKVEFEKRLQAEESKARAENRISDLENQRKKLIEMRQQEESKRYAIERENKKKEHQIMQIEEESKIAEDQKRKLDEQTRLHEQELKRLQSQPAKIVHIYHSGGGICNIF